MMVVHLALFGSRAATWVCLNGGRTSERGVLGNCGHPGRCRALQVV